MLCSNRNGEKWGHVSCAWWIPEASFGNPEKMEPICDVESIPVSRDCSKRETLIFVYSLFFCLIYFQNSRWNLVCSLCREKGGACIQCSVRQCKVAFHVTCAFDENLQMTTNLDDESDWGHR